MSSGCAPPSRRVCAGWGARRASVARIRSRTRRSRRSRSRASSSGWNIRSRATACLRGREVAEPAELPETQRIGKGPEHDAQRLALAREPGDLGTGRERRRERGEVEVPGAGPTHALELLLERPGARAQTFVGALPQRLGPQEILPHPDGAFQPPVDEADGEAREPREPLDPLGRHVAQVGDELDLEVPDLRAPLARAVVEAGDFLLER